MKTTYKFNKDNFYVIIGAVCLTVLALFIGDFFYIADSTVSLIKYDFFILKILFGYVIELLIFGILVTTFWLFEGLFNLLFTEEKNGK